MSESAANKNWVQVPFGAVATLINGRAYKQPEMLSAGTPILRIQNLNGGSNWYYSDLDLPDDKYCNPGDLLYAWSASFGPYRYNGPKAIFHYHIWNVVPDAGIDKAFVYYQLLRITDALRQSAHGVAMPHITKAGMEAWEIGLPPFSEQKRIADKLDTVLTRVEACRDRLARVAPLLKRFRQSVLAAATSGRLTEDWRSTNAPEWLWRDVVLSDIANIQGGVTKDAGKQSASDEEVPYLRVANVQRCYLDLNDIRTIRVPPLKLESLLLKPGDILFNEGGDLDKLGRGWIWEGQIARCSFQNHVFRARLFDLNCHPKYISWWGNTQGLEYFVQNGKQTTNLASINKTMLKNLPISLPPLAEQTEIVRRVETLFAFADRLEARLKTAQTAADRLTPALLAKAFRGELVPQDPNDEPAAELLKRLAASRDAAPKAKRGRRSATADATP